MNRVVFIIAAHPDVAILGVGSTIRGHVLEGDTVHRKRGTGGRPLGLWDRYHYSNRGTSEASSTPDSVHSFCPGGYGTTLMVQSESTELPQVNVQDYDTKPFRTLLHFGEGEGDLGS